MIRGAITVADKPDKVPVALIPSVDPPTQQATTEEPDDTGEDDTSAQLAAQGIPDASDRRQVRERTRKKKLIDDEQKARAEERKMVLQSLLQCPPGRAFIAWLICDLTGVFTASLREDLHEGFSMHREGQRAVGLVLQGECLNALPEQYMVAIQRRLTQGVAK